MSQDLCAICGGSKTEGGTTYTVSVGSGVLVVKDVPARLCEQCGEVWLDDETMKRLEALAQEVRRQPVEVEVLQYREAV